MGLNSFGQVTLSGVSIDNPTSIQFGPDGRLYASQQNGVLKAFTIAKTSSGYQVTNSETIQIQKIVNGVKQFDSSGNPVLVAGVASIQNHNDDGSSNSVTGRQVTGLVATQDAQGRTVLYVSSSDPGYSVGEDSNLDTNSGIISRLTRNADGSWSKVDIVRGLPRSEENHATNGLALGTDSQGNPVLYVAQGGHTNMGAQGNSFSYTPEYYYSGAILKIDLSKIASLEASQGLKGTNTEHPWLFDLPTLNDPTRADASETVFGGNDGLNQAKFDPTGTVTVYSPGYRNAYDVVVTSDGKLYTYDNGPNLNWGGEPVNAQGQLIVDANRDGVPDNGPAVDLASEAGSSNYDDQLHLVTQGFYGGHPNPIRASGSAAGLHYYEKNSSGQWVEVSRPVPTDFSTINGGTNDPRQAIYKAPLALNSKGDPFDGSLHSIGASTNGIAEYTAAGDMQGDLLVVSWNGYMYRLPRNSDGTIDSAGVESRAVATKPLDVTTPPAGSPYHGTIWVAGYGTDKIYIFDPALAGDEPADPNDRDKDGINDRIDAFAADPTNGTSNVLDAGETLFWSFTEGQTPPNHNAAFFDGAQGLYNGFDIGFTGIMTDKLSLPEELFFQNNIIPGGAPGMLQVKQVWSGDARASKLHNGFQFGLTSSTQVDDVVVSAVMDNPFDETGGIPNSRDPSQGIFIGAGDQNNYLKLVAIRKDGQAGFEVGQEVAGTYTSNFYALPSLTNINAGDVITVKLVIDRATGVVTPGWSYTINGGASVLTNLEGSSGTISNVQLGGDSLKALKGEYSVSGKTSALAVGVISSDEQGAVVKAIQVGGTTSYTSQSGVVYAADTGAGFNGKTVKDGGVAGDPMVVSDYAGTADDALYTDTRSTGSETNELTYQTNIANGRYELTFQWAEIYHTSIGSRIFDVTVEGQKVADNLDIVAKVGPNAAYELTVPVTVLDGQLNFSINADPSVGGTDKPTLSAFVLREASSFAADWMDLTVQAASGNPPPTGGGEAYLSVNKGATGLETSTFNTNAFIFDNLSDPGVTITKMVLTLNNALLPNLAFDPQFDDPNTTVDDGPAGDSGPKNFTRDGGSIGTFNVTPSYQTAFSGGFRTMTLDFTGFDPGERLAFSIDQDPVSIKGGTPSSANQAGAISGLEQVGIPVTVFYSDGSQQTTELFMDSSTTNGMGAEAFIGSGLAAAPVISVEGITGPEATTPNLSQTIRVTGTAGQKVKILVAEGGAFPVDDNGDGVADNGYAFGTYEANKIVKVQTFNGTIGSNGVALIPVTLSDSASTRDGINFISAAFVDNAGKQISDVSNKQVLKIGTGSGIDDTAPSASGGAADLTTATTTHQAVITYSDSGSGVDPATIGTNDITVSGPGSVTVQSVSTQTNGNGSVTATYTLASPSGFTSADNGTHTIALVAGSVEDQAGNAIAAVASFDTFSVNIGGTPPPSDIVAAINVGGAAYTDADTGLAFAVDTAASPSPNLVSPTNISSNGSAIGATNDDALYQNYRWGKSFGYDFAVPAGDYVVEFKFSENYWGSAGNRIFDVLLEGQEVISNLDPFAAAGGKNIAFDVSRTVTVSDGTLTLRFDATGADDKDNAAIGAIVIRRASSTTDTAAPSASGGAADLTTATTTHQAVITYSDSGSGVDPATIGTNDITVSGPGSVTVQSVSTQTNGNGSVTATYTLASPSGFTSADNGTHTIALVAGSVEDQAGNAIAAVASFDTFSVNIGGTSTNEIVGTEAAETLNGTAGSDLIRGLGGNDTLNGQGGDDIIEGGTGNDKINGNAGADTLKGQAGNDIYFVDNVGDQVIELAGEGTETVNADISFTLPDNVENLLLRTAGSINGTGNTLNNRLEGNSGANQLSGGSGNDTLLGMGGNDRLEGGAGNDIYLFKAALNATTNVDQLIDFSVADDTIQLENAIFAALVTTGTLASGAFRLGASAADADDRIIYNQGSGALYYDADGSGTASSQIQFATLPVNLALSNSDFVVV